MRTSTRLPCALLTVALLTALAHGAHGVHGVAPIAEDEPINTMCPVMTDQAIDPAILWEHQGYVIGFCCRMCRTDFRLAPANYLPELAGDIADFEAAKAAAAAPASTPPAAAEGAVEAAADATLPGWVGRLHVIIIHFPLGLLVAAAVAELRARRKATDAATRAPDPTALFCLKGGAVTAALAALTGWTRAEAYTTPLDFELMMHRWLGVGVMGAAIGAWVLAARARRAAEGGSGGNPGAYRLVLYLCGAATLATGHFGGTLAWGKGFLFG